MMKQKQKQQVMSTLAYAFLVLSTVAGASAQLAQPILTPAERAIQKSRDEMVKNPNRVEGQVSLALALVRRSRETADPRYLKQAEEAVGKAFALDPKNFAARKAEVAVLLGEHQYVTALEKANALNRQTPDDISIYGYQEEAAAALGKYDQAEKAANWALRLRPGNVIGMTDAAELREAFGNAAGALELLALALQSTPFAETEERASLLTRMAHLNLIQGKLPSASQLLEQALASFPNYYYALAEQVKLRTAQGRYQDAVVALRQLYQQAPHPASLYDLAVALEQEGHQAESKTAFTEFEKQAVAGMRMPDNANRELIFYYADHANRPADALTLAQSEAASRQDVYTLDAYAWALYRNAQYEDGRKQIEKALAVGIKDATIFAHAGQIAMKQGDANAAEQYRKAASDLGVLASDVPPAEHSVTAQPATSR